jgi:hypothetical protein
MVRQAVGVADWPAPARSSRPWTRPPRAPARCPARPAGPPRRGAMSAMRYGPGSGLPSTERNERLLHVGHAPGASAWWTCPRRGCRASPPGTRRAPAGPRARLRPHDALRAEAHDEHQRLALAVDLVVDLDSVALCDWASGHPSRGRGGRRKLRAPLGVFPAPHAAASQASVCVPARPRALCPTLEVAGAHRCRTSRSTCARNPA